MTLSSCSPQSRRVHRIDIRPVTGGDADMNKASTFYVERQNRAMRRGMRRFSRLANGSSSGRRGRSRLDPD